jgi:hypothetical protein
MVLDSISQIDIDVGIYKYNRLPIIILFFSGLTEVDISDVDGWYLFDKDQKKKRNNSFFDIFIDGTLSTTLTILLFVVVIGKKNIVISLFILISRVVYRFYYAFVLIMFDYSIINLLFEVTSSINWRKGKKCFSIIYL